MVELSNFFFKRPIFSGYLLWFRQLLLYFLKIGDFIINDLEHSFQP